MCLRIHDNNARASLYSRPLEVMDSDSIAENELNHWGCAGSDCMHNLGAANVDLTLGVEANACSRPCAGWRKRDVCTGHLFCWTIDDRICPLSCHIFAYMSQQAPGLTPTLAAGYRDVQRAKWCHAALGPISPARSGPDANIKTASVHVRPGRSGKRRVPSGGVRNRREECNRGCGDHRQSNFAKEPPLDQSILPQSRKGLIGYRGHARSLLLLFVLLEWDVRRARGREIVKIRHIRIAVPKCHPK